MMSQQRASHQAQIGRIPRLAPDPGANQAFLRPRRYRLGRFGHVVGATWPTGNGDTRTDRRALEAEISADLDALEGMLK